MNAHISRLNAHISRRDFAAGLGGIVVAFTLAPKFAAGQQAAALPGSLNGNRMLDAWIRIAADGSATVCTGKVELGQGIATALKQIAAEELDLPLERVHMIAGDTEKTPNEGFTSGSQSIENGGVALRLAGAEVRAILLDLAAKRLGVDAASLAVADGVISTYDGRKVTYADLAEGANLHREVSAKAKPKSPSAHRIVGKSIARVDIPAKVTGGVAYVQDLRLPGMLHGRVVRPPGYGAKLEAIDDAKIKAMPGVVAVVRDGSFLGVIAEREEQAIRASVALGKAASWIAGPPLPDQAALYDHLLSLPDEPHVISEKQTALPESVRTIEATYHRPYTCHAAIGPSCAVAQFTDGKMTVWTHSQGVFPLRGNLAMALKLPPERVHCIHAEGSGCYGHNGADDVALDAALLARAAPGGRPVRLQWMRGDEFGWEPFGPAMVMKAKAALSADGRIVDWNYDVWTNTHSTRPDPRGNNLLASWYLAEPQKPAPPAVIPQPAGGGDRNAVPLYDFPRQRVVHHFIREMPLRVSALRTLGAYANVFAMESFMDELALAAGVDPVAFRLAHLKDPRARAVIEAVARKAGWKARERSGGGKGRGIGFAKYKNLATYVAVIADVEVDAASGKVAVPRAWAAADSGLIINPDGLANQIEGGIIQSTSWTLHEEVKFASTGIKSRDWLSYPILTMPEVPKVEVELINRPEERSLGAGEASQGPMAAAIANAFAAATGKRVRELPLTPERVKAVMRG
ncbi:MAG TPA: molybdopterin cofactor-binding domain-containing protein [Xanthobacteraceae bacterium]|jgi:CO/xanthine dehydrogenase Mo-binding subunit|nr:molybdopterin cofactor-binding domain-containing protein [Xanthobacteraceae bacterium]